MVSVFLVENSPIITLWIAGDDRFGSALSDLQDETARCKRLTIRHRLSDDLRGWSILFLTTSEKHHAAKILRNIENSDVLTVVRYGGGSPARNYHKFFC